jgi:hypothetical protein
MNLLRELLKKFGTAAKDLTALIILGSLVTTGFAGVFFYFAPASAVERAFAMVAQNSLADKEFRTRYEISQIRRDMREISVRQRTEDPLTMSVDARDHWFGLKDDLDYYEGVLKAILEEKRPKEEK